MRGKGYANYNEPQEYDGSINVAIAYPPKLHTSTKVDASSSDTGGY